MKTIRILVLFAILVLQNVCLSQNIVPNGNFENDFTGWTQQGTVAISTSVVQAGAKALMAVNPDTVQYSYAWQAFNLDYNTHEINFWFFPASATYFNTFELIADWNSSPAPVIFITRVHFREDRLDFYAVDRGTTISNILTANSWNKVTIQVNKATLTQDFFINNLASSITTTSFPTIEHLLVGDLSVTQHFGTVYFDEISITDSLTVGISELSAVPSEFELEQNYPNPFNPSTTIVYQTTSPGPVVLKVYNIYGQEVATLVDQKQLPGSYSTKWDGTSKDGQRVSSGVYLYRLTANGFVKTRKMLAIK